MRNIALQTNGGSCSASSEYDDNYLCENAIDGQLGDHQDWASKQEGPGAWIKVNFNQTYKIVGFELRNRNKGGSDIARETKIEFSDESPPMAVCGCF